MRLRDAIRHILLGGIIAAGMGSLSLALIARWLGLPPEAVPAGAASGSAAYLVGVFGPAVIEVFAGASAGSAPGRRCARCVNFRASSRACAAKIPIPVASSGTGCGSVWPSRRFSCSCRSCGDPFEAALT